jgi:hypothetical protein
MHVSAALIGAIEWAIVVVGGRAHRLRFVSAMPHHQLSHPPQAMVLTVETVRAGELVRASCPVDLAEIEDVPFVVRSLVERMRHVLSRDEAGV